MSRKADGFGSLCVRWTCGYSLAVCFLHSTTRLTRLTAHERHGASLVAAVASVHHVAKQVLLKFFHLESKSENALCLPSC